MLQLVKRSFAQRDSAGEQLDQIRRTLQLGILHRAGEPAQCLGHAIKILGREQVSLGQVVQKPLDRRGKRIGRRDFAGSPNRHEKERYKLEAAFQYLIHYGIS